LVLGMIPGLPDLDLGDLLAQFHQRHPQVQVTLREDQPAPLVEGLLRGGLDAAIVGLSDPVAPDGLGIEVVTIEPLALVTSADHPLASRDSVTIESLRDVPLVTLSRGSSHRRTIEAACSGAGFSALITLETSDCDLLTDLVARGLGVTVLPVSIAAPGVANGRLRVIELTAPRLRRCTALAWRAAQPTTPATRVFVALAHDVFTARGRPAGSTTASQSASTVRRPR
ncbi:MAG: LysR family transcriptional regulator substrate-binding protein, partial [Acidimicrobiales bacterium]